MAFGAICIPPQAQAFNPGMKMPGSPFAGGVGIPGLTQPHGPAGAAASLQAASGQMQVDQVAYQDASLTGLARSGQLNKDEFISLSAQQNEMARLSGQFAADGTIDEGERAQLNARRSQFQENLAQYRTGDFHPETQQGRKGIAGTQDRQSAFLFDNISNGRLSPQQAFNLRQNMSAAGFAQGQEGGLGVGAESQIANTNGRLTNIWSQMGAAADPQAAQPRSFGGII